jgi:chromosome segregation ATPase
MPSIWDKFRDTFSEVKPDAQQPEAPPPVSEATVGITSSPVIPARVVAADPALITSLDQSARDQLIAAMEASGAHLVEELIDLLDTMKENITDEAALYKTAVKILVKKGHTLVDIRQDFDKCIGALEAKDREFESQLKGQLDLRVGSKSAAVAACKSQIADKQAEITKLQSQIAELGAKAHEAQEGIAAEQGKLGLAQSRFSLGYNALRGEIASKCAKVNQYSEKL